MRDWAKLERAILNADLDEVKALLENCAEPIDALLQHRDDYKQVQSAAGSDASFIYLWIRNPCF